MFAHFLGFFLYLKNFHINDKSNRGLENAD